MIRREIFCRTQTGFAVVKPYFEKAEETAALRAGNIGGPYVANLINPFRLTRQSL